MTISVKLFSILITSFSEEIFKVSFVAISHANWQPCFFGFFAGLSLF